MLAPLRQWLFRFAPDDPGPIVISRLRIFILPTRGGLLFALALFVMLIGAINYNLSLGYALVFLLAGLALVTMVHTYRNLIALRLTPGRADPVFAGEIARFHMRIDNPQRQPRRALELAFGEHPAVALEVAALAQAGVDIPCPAPTRGRLEPGRITLSTRYPLGLFYAWSYPQPSLRCLVYPQPIETPLPIVSAIADYGQRTGDSGQEDFSGLRLRQPNDSPRHIAWKAVARNFDQCPLLVKQFIGGGAEQWMFDWEHCAATDDVERRLSILTGWVLAADAQHLRYGLRLPGRTLTPALGPAQRAACLEALALFGHE